MQNLEYCQYTYKHRKALTYLINKNKDKLTDFQYKELLKRAKVHDIDKLVMYQFATKKEVHDFHRKNNRHHIENELKDFKLIDIDILETIFDCECAALTKLDKPRNAYKTFKDFYPDFYNIAKPYLVQLDMDYNYSILDIENNTTINYYSNLEVTETMIKQEIKEYLNINNALN